MQDGTDKTSEISRNIAAILIGLKDAAQKELVEAENLVMKARELRDSAVQKLELAEELAKVTAEYESGIQIASDLDVW